MARVLVSNIMMLDERPRFDRELRDRGHEPVWAEPAQFLTEAQCLELVGDIDGWLAGDDRITREVMTRALPRLRVIAKWGTGLDSIDLAAARELGLPVLNSPGAFATAVAEVALGYMLSLSRHLSRVDRAVRRGDWPKPRGRELTGSTLGLVGFGAIGRRIGEFAGALGMRVRFSDPAVTAPVELGTNVAEPASASEIAAGSDFVCLACSLGESSHHIVDAAFLDRMKPSSYLVNVARGPVVDEAALVEALREGRIAGAALDVFETEPLASDSPLLRMDEVIVGSHNANNAVGAVEAVHRNTLDNLTRHLD